MNIKHLQNCIASCVVLHNFCEIHGKNFDYGWLATDDDDDALGERNTAKHEVSAGHPISARVIRDALMWHLLNTDYHNLVSVILYCCSWSTYFK